MNGLLKGAALLSMLFVGPGTDRQEPASYLCIPDLSTGFVKKGGNWVETKFNIEGKKLILSSRDGTWQFSEFGEEPSFLDYCTETATADAPFYHCGIRGLKQTTVNVKTLRYQSFFAGTYISEAPNAVEADTPYIEIGKCSPL